jgi:hypothetical protein
VEKCLVARRTVLRRATSAALGSPCGQGKGRAPGYTQWVRTYCKESTGPPLRDGRTPKMGPRPFRVGSGLITAGSRDSGTRNTRTLPWKGSGDDMCPDPAWCEPVHATFLFPGQAETWYSQAAYYDVSMQDGPDVGPLGHAAPAFIVERTRRLTTPLTGDVPSQRLMRPVHSASRRRQGHPADGAPS